MRDLGFFFCLANLAAALAHFLWAHLRVPMAQFKGEKSQPRVPDGRGTPGTEKTAPTVTNDREGWWWRSGVIGSAADPEKGWTTHMMCAYP